MLNLILAENEQRTSLWFLPLFCISVVIVAPSFKKDTSNNTVITASNLTNTTHFNHDYKGCVYFSLCKHHKNPMKQIVLLQIVIFPLLNSGKNCYFPSISARFSVGITKYLRIGYFIMRIFGLGVVVSLALLFVWATWMCYSIAGKWIGNLLYAEWVKYLLGSNTNVISQELP